MAPKIEIFRFLGVSLAPNGSLQVIQMSNPESRYQWRFGGFPCDYLTIVFLLKPICGFYLFSQLITGYESFNLPGFLGSPIKSCDPVDGVH